MKQNPLAGNVTAKELKKFFRSQDIQYMVAHGTVIPLDARFPPIVFRFEKLYCTVYSKYDERFMYSFFAPTINVLFEKLIKWRLATPKQLTIIEKQLITPVNNFQPEQMKIAI